MNKMKGGSRGSKFILWFDEVGKGDINLVGGKNANLGEMYQNLSAAASKTFPREKIQVPYGFAVTSAAYRFFIKENKLDAAIRAALKGLNTKDMRQLEERGRRVRHAIMGAEFPAKLAADIRQAHIDLAKKLRLSIDSLDLAVRSSATAEDLPTASFAGQQESYLNVQGEEELFESIKKAFASLFTNRAISYRVDKHFDHFDVALSVAVQKMARSDRGSSGVMFTLDTDTGFRDAVLINASWGLGEYIVKGVVTPDEYVVFKPTLKLGYDAIVSKKLGSKEKKLIYATRGGSTTKETAVEDKDRYRFALSEKHILQLARWGVIIEEHYKRPMDIEWAYDAVTDALYIVQARPETVEANKLGTVLEEYQLLQKGAVVTTGTAVGAKIGQGKAHVIRDVSEISKFKPGEVLVTEITDPDWEPIMKIASAIVTDTGGRTSHAAIISRELGIPTVVGCGNATEVIKPGARITVSCAEGEMGKVYAGILPFNVKKYNLKNFEKPRTEIKMIAADPQLAFRHAMTPNSGIGLAREEFIFSNYVKVHPNALLNYESLRDAKVKLEIDELTRGYKDKVEYCVQKLAYGIGMLAAAFYPYEVVLRFSDFKTNEYRNLIGGEEFEPEEENPMLGWRGASRYYDPKFSKAFALECEAVKRVRNGMGLWNLKVMIPFCRTPEEGRKVMAELKKNGLLADRNKTGTSRKVGGITLNSRLAVWCMAEIPSNVLQAEEFAEIFDAFSIGSNDLTQLTLGLDRDSGTIAHIGNERNASVKRLIKELITTAHKAGKKVGICGQGPSDLPDFAEFLVREGIDSISIAPDTVLKATMNVKKVEDAISRSKNKKRR